jgi:hypothetical protein
VQNNTTNSKQFINYEDRRILAKEAMRALLEQVLNMKAKGTSEQLSVQNIQNAKEYYWKWKKDRTTHKKLGVSLGLGVFFGYLVISNMMGIGVSLFIASVFALLTYLVDSDITKCRYVSSMLGALDFIPNGERQYYINGLKVEIFGGLPKCTISKIRILVGVLLVIAFTILSEILGTNQREIFGIFAGITLAITNMLDNNIKE